MVLEAEIADLINASVYGFSLSEAFVLWKPLIIFVIGVAIYSIFVFKFYRFLARKNIFELKIHEYDVHKNVKKLLYFLEYIILFPLVVFFWFLVMSVLLTMISTTQSIQSILFISVAFVSAVRIAAYYHEDLSRDIAKLIPFSLLAIFLIDASFMSWDSTMALINQLPSMGRTLIYYLFFVIFLELVLRVITMGRHHAKRRMKTDTPAGSSIRPKPAPEVSGR